MKFVNGVLMPETEDDLAQREADGATAIADSVRARATALLAVGMQIASRSRPELNGTYAIDAEARANIAGIISALAAGLGFPLDATELAYSDVQGVPHSFTPDDFKKLAKAVGDYVFRINMTLQIKLAGGEADWPGLPVQIA